MFHVILSLKFPQEQYLEQLWQMKMQGGEYPLDARQAQNRRNSYPSVRYRAFQRRGTNKPSLWVEVPLLGGPGIIEDTADI